MTRKSFIVILILSVVMTYISSFIDEAANLAKNPTGFPFGFAYFNFLGGSYNTQALILDIVFWFLVIWGIWKLILKGSGR